MPGEKNGWLKINPKIFITIVVLTTLFVLFLYYLVQYLGIDKTPAIEEKKDSNYYEIITDSHGKQFTVKRQYPVDTKFPSFIHNRRIKMSDDKEYSYDFAGFLGVEVVSTGNFSMTTIKSEYNGEKLAEIQQLEVYINDKEKYLQNNEPFNIAIRVYAGPLYQSDIAPMWLLSILQQLERKKILSELSSSGGVVNDEVVNRINRRAIEVSEKYEAEGVDQDTLYSIFEEGTTWVMSPYLISGDRLADTFIEKDYSALLGSYYGENDSKFIDKILSKDISNVKSPVMITGLSAN